MLFSLAVLELSESAKVASSRREKSGRAGVFEAGLGVLEGLICAEGRLTVDCVDTSMSFLHSSPVSKVPRVAYTCTAHGMSSCSSNRGRARNGTNATTNIPSQALTYPIHLLSISFHSLGVRLRLPRLFGSRRKGAIAGRDAAILGVGIAIQKGLTLLTIIGWMVVTVWVQA